MSDKTGIQWTDATWNPVAGCSIVSPGCTNCYAMRMAARLQKMNRTGASNTGYVNHYDGTTKQSKAGPVWTGVVKCAPDHIWLKPLQWKRSRKIFVNSMSDLFHEDVPDEWIDRAFAIMALCPQHTFQVLTKRSARMRAAVTRIGKSIDILDRHARTMGYTLKFEGFGLVPWPLPNVWLGVSAERQQEADERIPDLLATPAAVKFVSAEPLLGPINLTEVIGKTEHGHDWMFDALTPDLSPENDEMFHGVHIDWVIVGGESGPDARPMHPDWARSLRDQCAAAGVAIFFKQWGEWKPHKPVAGGDLGGDVRAGRVRVVHPSGRSEVEIFEATGGRNTEPGTRYVERVGKKAAGRLLDGVEHNGFPAVRA